MYTVVHTAAQRPPARRWLAAAAGLAIAATGAISSAKAQDTIKVGILHSLSGTMAISETTLKDTMLFLIDEQNKKGGLLGKKLEAVVVDPASNWPLFAEKARELIAKDKVAAVFGCWTSVSRKSVLPVFKEQNNHHNNPKQNENKKNTNTKPKQHKQQNQKKKNKKKHKKNNNQKIDHLPAAIFYSVLIL